MGMEFVMAAFAVALASGGAAGLVVRRTMLRNFEKRLKRVVAAANEQNATNNEKLRTAHNDAKLELEQMRTSVRDRIAAAVSAEKAASARLEGRLNIAYAELDSLREQVSRKAMGKRDLSNAFAQTEVMESRY